MNSLWTYWRIKKYFQNCVRWCYCNGCWWELRHWSVIQIQLRNIMSRGKWQIQDFGLMGSDISALIDSFVDGGKSLCVDWLHWIDVSLRMRFCCPIACVSDIDISIIIQQMDPVVVLILQIVWTSPSRERSDRIQEDRKRRRSNKNTKKKKKKRNDNIFIFGVANRSTTTIHNEFHFSFTFDWNGSNWFVFSVTT